MLEEKELKLDLGCGLKAESRSDFIGLDRFWLLGVDVIADMEVGLPFRDSAFDLIYASHSLEHIDDLVTAMREVWRIGKPGAQICILAPYYSTTLNLANPYHKQAFNEHTPRFWTSCPKPWIDPEEYAHPPRGTRWGLSLSDNSDPGLDLRCLRMEFFYFHDYWHLSPGRLRRLRRMYMDVCHGILYHLIVCKPPLTESDIENMQIDFFMPQHLEKYRYSFRAAMKNTWQRFKQKVRSVVSVFSSILSY